MLPPQGIAADTPNVATGRHSAAAGGAARSGGPLRGRVSTWRRAWDFLFPLATLVLLWQAVYSLGLVNPVLVPSPQQVLQALITNLSAASGFLFEKDMGWSFFRLIGGYLSAVVFAVAFGVAIGLSKPLHRFFSPILSIIFPIPALAWVPLVILWLGLGNITPMFIVFITAIFPIIYDTSAGVRGVDQKHVWAAQTMGAGRWQILTRVIIPGALAPIITGLKVGLASGWRALVAAEMLSATVYGLGYRIFAAKEFLQIPLMYASIIALAVLGFILENVIFSPLEVVTLRRWGMIRRG